MTIYIITAGEYSDYHICAVCSTRAQAADALCLYTDDWTHPEIEEWTLDEVAKYPHDLLPFIVVMDDDGNAEGEVFRLTVQSFNDKFQNGKALPNSRYLFHLWAKDKSHAVKIANEKRVQMIAMGEWK